MMDGTPVLVLQLPVGSAGGEFRPLGMTDLGDVTAVVHLTLIEPVMTIGTLARRTGVPVKTLREYEDLGLIYTVGRSAGNYRLFGEEALWCVGVVGTLRRLGLTLSEIQEIATAYLGDTREPVGPRLAKVLQAVRARTHARITELRAQLARIDEYQAAHRDELSGRADFSTDDPRSGPRRA
jgi:MerR family transcriptional regulator, copper efflux regulator